MLDFFLGIGQGNLKVGQVGQNQQIILWEN